MIQYQLSPETRNQTSITIKCAWAFSSGIQSPVFGCSATWALAINRSWSTACSQGSLIWGKVSKVALLTSERRKCCGKISTTNIEINDDVFPKDHRYVLTKRIEWNKSNKLPHTNSFSYNADTYMLPASFARPKAIMDLHHYLKDLHDHVVFTQTQQQFASKGHRWEPSLDLSMSCNQQGRGMCVSVRACVSACMSLLMYIIKGFCKND